MFTHRSLIPGQHRHSRRIRYYTNAYFSETVAYVYLYWLRNSVYSSYTYLLVYCMQTYLLKKI